ncbi:MAG: hypothetical protein ROW48_05230 [Bellilinea sp.]|jgi:hypothetical protein
MVDTTPAPQFEEEIRAAVAAPPAREEFVQNLHARLIQQAGFYHKIRHPVFLRPAWVAALIAAILLVSVTLIGPHRIAAAMRSLIGYLPGVGIVDSSAPIRILAEPVSLTRQGIVVSVNSATLTASQTHIEVGVSGVPLSAYPKNEAVVGCTEQSYLRLPDGTRLKVDDIVPADVNQAVYVMPCIFNTLPGTVPTDWELPLKFIPAPPDLTVMPIIDMMPAAGEIHPQSPPATAAGETVTPTPSQPVAVSVERVIETQDGYILIGAIRAQIGSGQSIQVTGTAVIRDANGQKVDYAYPQDIDPYALLPLEQNDQPFSLQIKGAGIAFPITIEFPGKIVTPADPNATAELTFHVEANPQPGQEWLLNQEMQLAGHTLKLVSIAIDSRNGYAFRFEAGREIASLNVQIEGYTPIGGGGGSDGQGLINRSISYAQLPTGDLKMLFSGLMLASETQFWEGQWAPESLRGDWPAATPATRPVCLNAESLSQLQPLPAGLDGMLLFTEIDSDFRLVLSGLDGSNRQVLAERINRGAFSPDGKKVAYPGSEGIVILDLAANTTEILRGVSGYHLRWSPDGSQIAYVTSGQAYGIFVVSLDHVQTPRQLSNLGYESLAGWSPDGKSLYYAIPGSSHDGFLLRAVEIATGITRDLFTLDDSSRKAPFPVVSPDGKWVAYRASNNSSVYLKAMDGTNPAWLVIHNPGLATSGIVWEKEGHLLGISLITAENPRGIGVLVQVNPCEAHILPGLNGEINGFITR